MWPIFRPFDKAVFDRIEPAIAKMRVEIGLIAYVMLPKAPLPNTNLSLLHP
jgi:hypothetical protein